MDGTLTVAVHDFSSFKERHGLPSDQPILEAMASLPPARVAALSEALEAWELELARTARPAPGAAELLRDLTHRGARLGLLTRNSHEVARITLSAARIDHFFEVEAILGRTCAPPKPSPAGIRRLLGHWGTTPQEAVRVGDYRFDIEAGRAAGLTTILVGREGAPADGWGADHVYADLVGLCRDLADS